MKKFTVRSANLRFSALLAHAERGETVLITKRGKPVAMLSPYRPPAQPPAMTAERKAAIDHAIKLMEKGLDWPEGVGPPFTRDEMHER
jgi:prevent-host-death family protein